MFIAYTTGVIKNNALFDLYRSQKVKSEVAAYCKLTFMMKTNYVPSFMLLSKSASSLTNACITYCTGSGILTRYTHPCHPGDSETLFQGEI